MSIFTIFTIVISKVNSKYLQHGINGKQSGMVGKLQIARTLRVISQTVNNAFVHKNRD